MKTQKTIKYLALALLLSASVISCKKNTAKKDADLNLAFQTTVKGENYALNTTYKDQNGGGIKVEKFQFYLSDITLTDKRGEVCVISEIELITFDDAGKALKNFKIPKGKYKSIELGIGVKQTLNEGDPAQYSSADHPLSVTQNTYWGWAGLYRFIMTEGRFDENNDGDFENAFAYHTGHNVSYRTLKIDHEFKVVNKEATTLNFEIDLYEMLHKSGTAIDVPEEPMFHGNMEKIDISTRISDNMLSALKLVE